MNTPETDPLLRDLLADEQLDSLRRTSLESLLAEVRRTRARRLQWERLGQATLALIFTAGLVWLTFSHDTRNPRPGVTAEPAKPPVGQRVAVATESPERQVRIISDEELFALFPGRAMALIGPPGKQELVFLDRVAQN